MTPKVPISDTGTATLGISVARALRRNRNTTRITSADRDHQRALDFAQRGADGRRAVHRRHAGRSRSGSRRAAAAAARCTRSTVSMMLAPGCRLMISSTAGLPLAEPALRRSCTESTTSRDVGRAAPARRCGRRRSAAGTRPPSSPGRWRGSASAGRRPRPRPWAGSRWPPRSRRARPRGRCRTC